MAYDFQLNSKPLEGMEFRVQSSLQYLVNEASSIVLNIRAQQPSSEIISCEPNYFSTSDLSDSHRLIIIDVPEEVMLTINYEAFATPVHNIIDCSNIDQVNVSQLDANVFPYLYPSRYCPSDQLINFATSRFDHYTHEFEKVLAFTNWIHEHVEYISGSTNSATSATDIILQQSGVCRDFAHLGISLCRALNIPARYCSAYAYQLEPQDFHACFEAFIGNVWIVFDATRKAPLNGLIKIAHGRDAADTAVASLFGSMSGTAMQVEVNCVTPGFSPFFYELNNFEGISLG